MLKTQINILISSYSGNYPLPGLPPGGRSTAFPPWGKMKGGLFRKNKEYVNTGYGSLNEYIKTLTAQRVNKNYLI